MNKKVKELLELSRQIKPHSGDGEHIRYIMSQKDAFVKGIRATLELLDEDLCNEFVTEYNKTL